jgi:hypothetical protein
VKTGIQREKEFREADKIAVLMLVLSRFAGVFD